MVVARKLLSTAASACRLPPEPWGQLRGRAVGVCGACVRACVRAGGQAGGQAGGRRQVLGRGQEGGWLQRCSSAPHDLA